LYTYAGYRRYHSELPNVCHGPDGMGSSYRPGAEGFVEDDELRRLSFVVCGGVEERPATAQDNVMPAFGR